MLKLACKIINIIFKPVANLKLIKTALVLHNFADTLHLAFVPFFT